MQKPVWIMILFGIVRHVLGWAGLWLVSRGLIDADTHARLLEEGTTQVVGILLMVGTLAWSILQKTQVWAWVKTALHLDSENKPSDAVKQSPGPNVPLILFLPLVMTVTTSCAGMLPSPQQTPQDSIRKGVIAFHDGLYLPTMTILGSRLDAGQISPDVEDKIQAASERYVRTKDEIDVILRTWEYLQSPERQVNDKIQELLKAIGDIQLIEKGQLNGENRGQFDGGGGAHQTGDRAWSVVRATPADVTEERSRSGRIRTRPGRQAHVQGLSQVQPATEQAAA